MHMTSIPCTHVCIQRDTCRHTDTGREIQCLGPQAAGTKLPEGESLNSCAGWSQPWGRGETGSWTPRQLSPLLLGEGGSWPSWGALVPAWAPLLPSCTHACFTVRGPFPPPATQATPWLSLSSLSSWTQELDVNIRAGRILRAQRDKCPQGTAEEAEPGEGYTTQDPQRVRGCTRTGAQLFSPAQGPPSPPPPRARG